MIEKRQILIKKKKIEECEEWNNRASVNYEKYATSLLSFKESSSYPFDVESHWHRNGRIKDWPLTLSDN